jgi:hypothetical protein
MRILLMTNFDSVMSKRGILLPESLLLVSSDVNKFLSLESDITKYKLYRLHPVVCIIS